MDHGAAPDPVADDGHRDRHDVGHDMDTLISRVHDTAPLAVLAVTGGGVAALSWLLGVPGASRTVLEAAVPYAATALSELLGAEPAQAVSAGTAAAMARACLRRAARLAPDPSPPLLGLGATAALVSDRPKRGEHRAHVALAWHDGAAHDAAVVSAVWSLTLDKGARDRLAEDALVSELVVAVLAAGCGLDAPVSASLRPADVVVPAWPTPHR